MQRSAPCCRLPQPRLLLLLGLVGVAGCSSPTHTVDPHPGELDPQRNTSAYASEMGTNTPAGGGDAAAAAGAALIDTALIGRGGRGNASARVTGHCIVEDGGPAVPCGSMPVLLEDASGNVVARTRTDSAGDFAFAVPVGAEYVLRAGGQRYRAGFEPSDRVRAGATVTLRLR